MKKLIVLLIAATFLLTPLAHAAGNAANAGASTSSTGPAPNSGDGVPDGSGMDMDNVACQSVGLDQCPGLGPAPNSGDGVPDGSGF